VRVAVATELQGVCVCVCVYVCACVRACVCQCLGKQSFQ